MPPKKRKKKGSGSETNAPPAKKPAVGRTTPSSDVARNPKPKGRKARKDFFLSNQIVDAVKECLGNGDRDKATEHVLSFVDFIKESGALVIGQKAPAILKDLAGFAPEIFQNREIADLLASFLEQDKSVPLKRLQPVAILICRVLCDCFQDSPSWPASFVVSFVNDEIRDQVWSRHEATQEFVKEVKTAFRNESVQIDMDEADSSTRFPLAADKRSIVTHVINRIVEGFSSGAESHKAVEFLAMAVCYPSVRLAAAQRLKGWLQYPGAANLLLQIGKCCDEESESDLEVLSCLMKLDPRQLLNTYLQTMVSLVQKKEAYSLFVLGNLAMNEAQHLGYNKMLLSYLFPYMHENRDRDFAEVLHEYAKQFKADGPAARRICRRSVNSLYPHLRFDIVIQTLLNERPDVLELDEAGRISWVENVQDFIVSLALSTYIQISKSHSGKAMDIFSFCVQLAEVHANLIFWCHTVIPTYVPNITSRVFTTCLRKVLMLLEADEVLSSDDEDSFMDSYESLRNSLPFAEDGFIRLLCLNLTSLPISKTDSIGIVENVAKRAVRFQRKLMTEKLDKNVEQSILQFCEVKNPQIIDALLKLCGVNTVRNVQNTYYFKSLLWRVVGIIMLLSAYSTKVVGNYVWTEFPFFRNVLQMCMTGTWDILNERGEIAPETSSEEEKAIFQLGKLIDEEEIEAEQVDMEVENIVKNFASVDVKSEKDVRSPPREQILALSTLCDRFSVGEVLRQCREPDFLMDLISRCKAMGTMTWVSSIIKRDQNLAHLLPISVLTSLVCSSEEKSDPSVASAISDRLGNLLALSASDEERVSTVELLAKTLASRDLVSRSKAQEVLEKYVKNRLSDSDAETCWIHHVPSIFGRKELWGGIESSFVNSIGDALLVESSVHMLREYFSFFVKHSDRTTEIIRKLAVFRPRLMGVLLDQDSCPVFEKCIEELLGCKDDSMREEAYTIVRSLAQFASSCPITSHFIEFLNSYFNYASSDDEILHDVFETFLYSQNEDLFNLGEQFASMPSLLHYFGSFRITADRIRAVVKLLFSSKGIRATSKALEQLPKSVRTRILLRCCALKDRNELDDSILSFVKEQCGVSSRQERKSQLMKTSDAQFSGQDELTIGVGDIFDERRKRLADAMNSRQEKVQFTTRVLRISSMQSDEPSPSLNSGFAEFVLSPESCSSISVSLNDMNGTSTWLSYISFDEGLDELVGDENLESWKRAYAQSDLVSSRGERDHRTAIESSLRPLRLYSRFHSLSFIDLRTVMESILSNPLTDDRLEAPDFHIQFIRAYVTRFSKRIPRLFSFENLLSLWDLITADVVSNNPKSGAPETEQYLNFLIECIRYSCSGISDVLSRILQYICGSRFRVHPVETSLDSIKKLSEIRDELRCLLYLNFPNELRHILVSKEDLKVRANGVLHSLEISSVDGEIAHHISNMIEDEHLQSNSFLMVLRTAAWHPMLVVRFVPLFESVLPIERFITADEYCSNSNIRRLFHQIIVILNETRPYLFYEGEKVLMSLMYKYLTLVSSFSEAKMDDSCICILRHFCILLSEWMDHGGLSWITEREHTFVSLSSAYDKISELRTLVNKLSSSKMNEEQRDLLWPTMKKINIEERVSYNTFDQSEDDLLGNVLEKELPLSADGIIGKLRSISTAAKISRSSATRQQLYNFLLKVLRVFPLCNRVIIPLVLDMLGFPSPGTLDFVEHSIVTPDVVRNELVRLSPEMIRYAGEYKEILVNKLVQKYSKECVATLE